jgi:hypothetical protein
MTSAAARLADRTDSVTDEIWAEATRHSDEGPGRLPQVARAVS